MAVVNPWPVAAGVLILGLIPCLIVLVRAPLLDRLVILEMVGAVSVLILVILSHALGQPIYHDLALGLALLAYPAGFLFVRVVERGP